ncbi:MAG: periplasmic heavy metal sensor [Desulfobacterales bacterium]
MKENTSGKILLTLGIVLIVGFGTYAFAHMGTGFVHRDWMPHSPGMHHGWSGGLGYGYSGDISDEEIAALEKERKGFLEAMEGLRNDLYSKELELRSELAKENPDTEKANELQKKISDLEAKRDKKHIDHMLKIRKLTPNVGRGLMAMDHMGYGYHYPGSCW